MIEDPEKRLEFIQELVEIYGLERILEDNRLCLSEALDILDELGFLYLDMYEEQE